MANKKDIQAASSFLLNDKAIPVNTDKVCGMFVNQK
jgi:hypothetical protein